MTFLDKSLLKNNIENAANYDFINNKVFGSAYAVIVDGEIIYKNCFGYTSVDSKIEVTGDTLFRLASMTKPITAFAALILIDKGILSLTDPVSKFLPEFENIHIKTVDDQNELIDLGPTKNGIKIANLLSHTSGIGGNLSKLKKMTAEDKSSIDNTIKFLVDNGLDFEPGTKAQYSGFGSFDVLVKIIEKITKTDFPSFLQKEIFEPCQMTSTTFFPTEKQWENLIDMHNKADDKSIVGKTTDNCIFFNYPCTHYLGGAGLVSTLNDYLKFAEMLLNGGRVSQKPLISQETFNLMSAPYVPKDIMPQNQNWGLGVRVIVDESYPFLPVGSFGWSGAYGSHFWIDPQNKIAAVFMKNSLFDGGSGNESARKFEEAVYNSKKD